jgi:trans-aconitate methyltransferase
VNDDETHKVAQRYARRGLEDANADRYSPRLPEVWQMLQERQRAMLQLFNRVGLADFAALNVTEVGCGGGGNLLELLRLGFAPQRLTGLELLPERWAQARACLPEATTLHLGDATQAALAPASQDMVLVSTVFSSLLDDAFQQRLAQAMWGWIKPGGAVLWYDFAVNNPRNRDVRGVPLRRVRELFPEAAMTARRVTLAPPLARAVCRLHPSLYTLFNALPLLRTHRLVWLAKPR